MASKTETLMTIEEMAERVAHELDGDYFVNLGIGMPMLVANHIKADKQIMFQAENGVLGVGPRAEPGAEDKDLGNAGDENVTVITGASFMDSATAFDMIRGGHLDSTVLGGFQVSESGDLANWKLPNRKLGSFGGAMDLAVGARKVIVMMKHVTNDGEKRIVRECSYPLTAKRCVSTIVTDIAVIDVTAEGLVLREIAPGWTPEDVQKLTEPPLIIDRAKPWTVQ
ncbi:MAG: 3-oxoacid CoA-transferase subunit B [bacterium]